MANSDRLLEIITNIDTLVAQLRVEGNQYASGLAEVNEDLMWLFHELTEYEE